MTPKQRDLLCRIAHHGVRVPPTYGPGIALVGAGLAYRRKGYLRLTTAGELRADALGLYGQGPVLGRVWRLLAYGALRTREIAAAIGVTTRWALAVLAEMAALGMVRKHGAVWAARRGA